MQKLLLSSKNLNLTGAVGAGILVVLFNTIGLTNSEVRTQKSEVIFVTGIRATLQKYFALKGGVARPNYFDKNRLLLLKNDGI
ncbi:MAG: hypothetical protein F6K22_33240 [Okeania sp. SIO2F4]|nr:hypothetical protein [Okeania sp. SIO2F4]